MMITLHHLSAEGNDKTKYAPPTEVDFFRAISEGVNLVPY